MNLSKGIKMFSDLLEKISRIIGGVSVAVFVVIISLQVVGRNILKVPMVWANDLSVVFFVWAVFFGSAIAVRYRKHYVLEFLPEKFAKTNCFLDIVGDISGVIFFYILIRYGYQYTIMGLVRLSPSMNIPQAYFFACIPLSGCFMMWYTILNLAEDFRHMASLLGKKEAIHG